MLKNKKLSLSFLAAAILFSHACQEPKKEIRETAVVKSDKLIMFSENEYVAKDVSPLDIVYFPVDYPLHKIENPEGGGPVARVIYSRPARKKRNIFGEDETSLCPYGRPWRLGANEATEIEFFRPVTINKQRISAGRYIMYCIPYADKWNIRLNSDLYGWGLQFDSSKDVLQAEIPVLKQEKTLEDFTIVFIPSGNGMELLMAWDNVKAILPIQIN